MFVTSLEHVLAVLILLGRLGDVGSTLFITPTMLLEANPIARRFRWPVFALGFVLCAVPYYSVELAVVVAVPSLLVTASNLSRGWFSRAVGEKEMESLLLRAATKSSLAVGLTMTNLAAAFLLLAAGLLFVLSAGPQSWGYWFAAGMGVYAVAIGLHGSLFMVRLFRRASRELGQPIAAG